MHSCDHRHHHNQHHQHLDDDQDHFHYDHHQHLRNDYTYDQDGKSSPNPSSPLPHSSSCISLGLVFDKHN